MNFAKHEKIFQTADRLAELLRSCPEYTHYMQARERLLQDPVNRKIFMELRQKQYDLEDTQLESDEFNQKQRFVNDLLMSLALNPVVNDYLNAEYSFGRIIEHITEIFEPIMPYDDFDDDGVEELYNLLETADKKAPGETSYLN